MSKIGIKDDTSLEKAKFLWKRCISVGGNVINSAEIRELISGLNSAL